jgi:hypothetical protein
MMVVPAVVRQARSWRTLATLFAALEAIAVTAWLMPASVHIVSWQAGGSPVRLALLSPTWQLLVWMASGVVVHGLLKVRGYDVAASRMLRPALVLWTLIVPYLPWLADRLPLLLVLAGPVRWVVIGGAMAASVSTSPAMLAAMRAVPRLGRRGVFVISFALYAGIGLWSVTTNGLGGDEPHYLVITESLLRDGDLRIENNHQRGDYRSFFRGDLRPDYMQRGQNGEIYSIHAPGLPAILLPVYAVAGYLGAVVFIAFLAALTAVAIFDLADWLAGRFSAVLTWMAVCLTVPFVPHSWAIFPEMPGALLVAWAALWLVRVDGAESARRWAVRGCALGLLPWLHTKFIVFLVIFSMALGLRLIRKPMALIALATPIAVSTGLWMYSFYAMYGKFDPEAPYGAYSRLYVLTSNIPHGLLGLFFDQKFGLLFYSPIYLITIAGAWFGLRDARLRFGTLALLVTIAAFVGSTARLYMFWGGSSAPARFFVPLLPCLAPFIALALPQMRSAVSKVLVRLWLGIGLGVAAIGIVSPARLMLFSDPHGRARILELLQAGSPLPLVVPTFTDPDWAAQVLPLVGWLGAAALTLVTLALVARTTRLNTWALIGVTCGTFLLAGAMLTAQPSAAVREETANRGDLDVLWRYEGAVFRTLDYETLSRTSLERFRSLTTLHVHPVVSADAKAPFEVGPLNLPPGTFNASVWFGTAGARQGEVLMAGPRAEFGRVSGPLGNPASFEVTLPVAARRVMVRVPDLDVARAVDEVQLEPRDIVPPSARDPRPVRAIESLPGMRNAYLVYTDPESYPEMGSFWSRGTAATTVLVAPGGASKMTLTLSTGPMSGVVTVTSGTVSRQVSMSAHEEQAIAIDVAAGDRLVPITIQSSVMFRPAEVEHTSSDMRGLGCQVRVALQ